jgi:nitronate monooxygenase
MNAPLCALLGIAQPILNAPMTPQSGGALARAVTDAGGFGMLGFDEGEDVASLREQVRLARGDGRRFGIGLVRWVLDARPELLDLALEAKPELVSISFGDPGPYVARFHAAGIRVASQVQSKTLAETALAAGVDLLVAQGTEGGGHTGRVGTLPLLQVVLDLAGDVPVIAAGGIATGRGLAAVLAAGAAGAWIGTPFLAAAEARNSDAARARLIASDETQTVLTRTFDRVQHKAWPREFPGRALRNAFTERWDGREDEMTAEAEAEFAAARARGDFDVAQLYAGQTVAFVTRVEPAAAIVKRIARDAETLLRHATSYLGALR